MGARLGTALVATTLVAAACGSDNDTAEPDPSSATTNTAAGGEGSTDDCSTVIAETFASGENLGGDLDIKIGAALLLSTSQAYYGQESLKGIELAFEQIAAAGGPTFTVDSKDLAVSTTAGADAVRAWGEAGDIHMSVAAGFFGTGSMIPLIDEYKILTIDPGGGTSTAFQGLPFAYGGRAITPDDSLAGAAQYVAETYPDATRWAITGYDIGELTKGAIAVLEELAAEHGAEIVGQALTALPADGPDFGKAVDELRAMEPDVIFNWVWGSDPALFMKQFDLSGMDALVIGPDYSPTTLELAGSGFDGYMFAYDYFNPDNPENPWAECFVSSFREKYGTDPDYYPANYYEDIFIFWETIQRTLEAGGDVNDGAELQEAFLTDPTFPSLYGAGEATGTIGFDPESHTLSVRPMGLFVLEDGVAQRLASFGIAGADFELSQ